MKLRINAAGCIRKEKHLDPHPFHQPRGEHYILHVIPFIIMHTAFHCNCRNVSNISQQKLSIVSLYSGHRKSGNITVRDLQLHFHIFCISAQTGPENQAHSGDKTGQ